jgi:hypothetical protein
MARMAERSAAKARRWRAVVARALGLLPVLALAMAVAGEDPRDLEALMVALAGVRQVEADYTETIESALLATVVSTRGRLAYTAPDRILKTGERGEQVEIAGDRVTIRVGGDARELSIRDYAPLERLVVALRATFAGDLERLRQDYDPDFRTVDGRWTLRLRPRDRSVLAAIERIVVAGRGAAIERIVIEESGGDRRSLQLHVRSLRPVGAP